MLVGVEAPVIAYSETVTDMIVRGKVARFLLYQIFQKLVAGETFFLSRQWITLSLWSYTDKHNAILYKQGITMLECISLGHSVACHHFPKAQPHDHWCRLYASLHLHILV